MLMQPENQTKKYDFLFADIDSGRIKIPKFQRDFVWTKEQTAKLIDSIIKGFPIGTFILWRTNEELRHFKNIGNIILPESPKGDSVQYVLDGQQRITSLYAVRKGAILDWEGEEIDFKEITINLGLDPDTDEQAILVYPPEKGSYISVHKLLNSDIVDLIDQFNREQLKNINIYRKRLTTYDFSTIIIQDYPLDIACEIFTRINTGGTVLTLFEIMVAKTYDTELAFDLGDKYQLLINSNNNGKDLEDADFDTVPPVTVLQCVAACLTRQVKRKDILKLKKNEFIESWPKVVNAIFLAVDYLRTYMRIPVSELLPYHSLLIPYTYFFYVNNGKPPTNIQDKLLEQFFWWASLSNRYSSAVESKMAQDIERVDLILSERKPSYRGEELNLTLDDLKYKWFSVGDAFCKALLCLYCWNEPKSFKNNGALTIDNTWLKTTSSKNYHHFFPRAYLKKKGVPDWQANSILNITLVDDNLNKKEIRAKAPSEYMANFKRKNKAIIETMKTHLIDDLDKFGVSKNNYEVFLEARGRKVIEELKLRLEPDLS